MSEQYNPTPENQQFTSKEAGEKPAPEKSDLMKIGEVIVKHAGIIDSVPGVVRSKEGVPAPVYGERVVVPMPPNPNRALGYNEEARDMQQALLNHLREGQ